jgi:hypothetical protein
LFGGAARGVRHRGYAQSVKAHETSMGHQGKFAAQMKKKRQEK